MTYVNELFEILVEVGKVILPFLVLCDQALLALQKLLPRLLQFLSLGMLMLDASDHEVMFARLAMFGMKLQEFFDRDQREG
jgi:hypothetical protein